MENEQLEPLAIEWIRKIQSVKVDGWCFFFFFFCRRTIKDIARRDIQRKIKHMKTNYSLMIKPARTRREFPK